MGNKISELMFLTSSEESKKNYSELINRTVKAIVDSFVDKKAFAGLTPYDLKKAIHVDQVLPEQGVGMDKLFSLLQEKVLPNMLRTSSTDYMAHLHTLALCESIAAELIIATYNQSMDSWDQSPAATEIEVEVVKCLCKLYGYDETSGGCFTSGGSQSNQTGLLLARDWYCNTKLNHDVKKKGLPANYSKFRFYTSEISHFSMEKSSHLMGLGYDAVVKVPVDKNQKMNIEVLKSLIEKDVQDGNLPVCVVATIGTTDYGSIDDVAKISKLCKEYGMYLHADAAYGSAVIMSDKYNNRIGNLALCDSITVDFHKMFLQPISCSAILVKDDSLFEALTLHADYLNREEDEEDGYTNLVGKSLQTTRRFDALKVWMSFLLRGKEGYSTIINTCIENAKYFYDRVLSDSSFETIVEPEISSVVFRLSASDEINKLVRRKLIHQDGIVIGQTVFENKVYLKFTLLNPLVTHQKLDELIEEIKFLSKQ